LTDERIERLRGDAEALARRVAAESKLDISIDYADIFVHCENAPKAKSVYRRAATAPMRMMVSPDCSSRTRMRQPGRSSALAMVTIFGHAARELSSATDVSAAITSSPWSTSKS
jgi:hypothetical protein